MNPETNQNFENINVDKIVEDIRKEAVSLNRDNPMSFRDLNKSKITINKIFKILNLFFAKETKYQHELDELLQYDDEQFIRNLYIVLLKREVDPYGLKVNLDKLRLQRATKIKIITNIVLSPEGQQKKIKIRAFEKHLLIDLIYSIPFLGYVLRIINIIINLPKIIDNNQTLQYSLNNPQFKYKYKAELNSGIDHSLDKLYLDFENQFRGSKKEIFKRQSKYIRFIKSIERSKNDIVLDLGCGRGEWLNVLKDSGIKSLGVDSNEYMIKSCKENMLEAVVDDFISFLEKTPINTFIAITGFQIVEHIPFTSLIKLFDLCFSALKPGGMVIFETPNPENLIVGACNFYTDPTHINPIPPHTLQFYIKSRGFIHEKIFCAARKKINIIDPNLEEFYNKWINIDPDYAVIARKPSI